MKSESRRSLTNVVRIPRINLLGRLTNKLRIAGKDLTEAQERAREARARVTPQQRLQELADFYTRYEDLVELLCDAAQYGPTPRLEARYEEIRSSLLERYIEMKPLLGAFLRPVEGLEEDNSDAFEALLGPRSVSDFLHSDDGDTIGRITRTREALNLYGEHLRQLSERTDEPRLPKR